ncbi:MAG: hypothetical protein Q8O24_00105 [Gallionellaceae bacterium]|nr:hypothetical protein [Gallionellaceae bacterium]
MKTQYNQGVVILLGDANECAAAQQSAFNYATQLGLAESLDIVQTETGIRITLREAVAKTWMPEADTLQLCEKLNLKPFSSSDDLEKEIVVAMCGSPYLFEYPSYQEFLASVHIRRNIVQAARRTALSFHTSKIERPEEFWTYSEDYGFILQPGKSLIDALRMATQPAVSGQQYSFSCYRASEYVIVLGIAQELANCNPALLAQLETHWQSRAIMSRKFHDTFLYEYGSMEAPLPPKFYVPGDRLWFRNPDEYSSDVEGYEGSWVIYLGSGLFTNFWVCDKPYSMAEKCVEIYHWRHGVEKDEAGNLRMNEAIVEARVKETMSDAVEVERILKLMMRLRDPSGVYDEGGCIDTSREYPRWVCVGTADMTLPAID